MENDVFLFDEQMNVLNIRQLQWLHFHQSGNAYNLFFFPLAMKLKKKEMMSILSLLLKAEEEKTLTATIWTMEMEAMNRINLNAEEKFLELISQMQRTISPYYAQEKHFQ